MYNHRYFHILSFSLPAIRSVDRFQLMLRDTLLIPHQWYLWLLLFFLLFSRAAFIVLVCFGRQLSGMVVCVCVRLYLSGIGREIMRLYIHFIYSKPFDLRCACCCCCCCVDFASSVNSLRLILFHMHIANTTPKIETLLHLNVIWSDTFDTHQTKNHPSFQSFSLNGESAISNCFINCAHVYIVHIELFIYQQNHSFFGSNNMRSPFTQNVCISFAPL